jgi:PKD repeat protein
LLYLAIPSTQSVTIGPKPLLLLTNGSTGDIAPTAVLQVTPLSGNAPLTVTADATGSVDQDGNIVERTIDFGDGTVITGATVSHTYKSAGSFQVKLSVKDDSGNIGTASQTATVLSGITVSVSPSTATVQSGKTQQFIATVQNAEYQAVTWSASLGTITSAGLYTAPTVTVSTAATITATAVADPSKFFVARVTINPPVLASSPTALINPGFELGSVGWVANTTTGATVRVVNNVGGAHGGANYAEAKSGPDQFIAYFAADTNGRPIYFPVQPGQTITFGGWVNSISGDGYARWKVQLSDANKSNITHVSPTLSTVRPSSGWTWMERSLTVPAGKSYVRFELQVYKSTVPTVVRFDDGMLEIK